MAKEPHSAIPSWSGYIYQGKLAFYEVLRVIKKQLKQDKNFNFSDYALEVEWQEDFAIKIGDNYKSIHQVKAYAERTSPTAYNEALDGLFHKLDDKIGEIGFLNLWKKIGFTERTKSKNFEQLKNNNQKAYADTVVKKVKIYKYCTGKETCDLDEADELILKKIEEIYKENSFNIGSLTSTHYEYVLFKLYQLLDTHILGIHKDFQNKKNETIDFDKIIKILNMNYEEYSDAYKYIKVKNKLLYLISRYCQDEDLCSEGEKECNHNCILYKVEKKLEQLNAKEVYNIVLNSTPQYRDYDSLIQEDGLKFGLIRILHELTDKCRTDEFHYKTDKYYLPTSITEPRNKKEIAKNILENKELKLLVAQFEIDIFISDNVKIESIENEAKKLKDFEQNELDSLYEKIEVNKIDKIKNIEIKPLDDIKKDINNAN